MILSISGNYLQGRRLPPQLMKVMKLTIFFLTAAFLQVHARSFSQITLSLKDAPLEKVFREIERQTGYGFLYTKKMLDDAPRVTIEAKNATVNDVLNQCLNGQSLEYSIDNNTIVITRKAPPKPVIITQDYFFLPIEIKGRVTDPDGEPLVGATVKVVGSNSVAVTDGDGRFILKGVDENASIEITYVGFVTETIPVKNRPNIFLALKRSDSKLDEVQVIAYGTTSQRVSTGNVTTVKGEDIQKQPVPNPLLALEGRVPGLFITQANGQPGSAVKVRIQGQNSIAMGNDPLYVIDGVPYTSQTLPGIGSVLGTGNVLRAIPSYGSPLSYINPADIESIDILKDADATAIYGSQAANGAVLITTKKGKAGQTKMDFNIQNGWGQVTRRLELLNTQQYLQMRREAFKNDGTTPSLAHGDYDLLQWDTTRYTDWQQELLGKSSQYEDAQLSISGGNANTQILVNGGYHRETTVVPGDFADQKGSLHFNINNVSSNQKFKIQLSGIFLVDNNKIAGNDITSNAISRSPNAPALYNSDGSLNWAPDATGTISTLDNPLSYLYNKYNNKTTNLIGNGILSYKILPGLEIKTNIGYTYLQANEIATYPLIATKPEDKPNTSRAAQFANNNLNSWIIEPQVTYRRTIWKGKFEMLAGTTIHQNNSDGLTLYASGYTSDNVLEDIKSSSSVQSASSIASVYKYKAVFGKLNYNLFDKYILSLNARRDGSSRFGSANRFHDFGSAGIGWIFSKERFIEKNLPFLSFGKLKASYGITGSDQIGDYQYLNLYSPSSVGVPYQGVIGLGVGVNGSQVLSNPYLQWEETKKLAIGMDLGFLSDKILFTVNYFNNRSSNQLLSYPLPIATGFNSVVKNFPATVQNSGWEFSINSLNFKTNSFSWTSSINLTIPKNKLISFPGLATSSYFGGLIIGQAITIQKAYHFLGVDPATGVYKFADINGNPTSSPNFSTDRNVLINTSPKFYGGIQNSFSFKGLQIDFLFQFVKQVGLNNLEFGTSPGYFFLGAYNQPTSVLNRWQKPGDVTNIRRYNATGSLISQDNFALGSDASYEDASFIRLKNLSLSWQLPQVWKQKAHLQNCRLYIQGQNLLTITRYRGLDPETLSNSSLPPLRVLTIGMQVGL